MDETQSEMKSLAMAIGIDYDSEFSKFEWYLRQCSRAKIPEDWIKELDPEGNIYYYNKKERKLSKMHPLINTFRKFFLDFVQ